MTKITKNRETDTKDKKGQRLTLTTPDQSDIKSTQSVSVEGSPSANGFSFSPSSKNRHDRGLGANGYVPPPFSRLTSPDTHPEANIEAIGGAVRLPVHPSEVLLPFHSRGGADRAEKRSRERQEKKDGRKRWHKEAVNDRKGKADRRRYLYALRFTSGDVLRPEAKNILHNYGVCRCGREGTNQNKKGITIERRVSDKGLFYSGLRTCGSVWTCPICAAKINEQRKKEVRTLLKSFQDSKTSEGTKRFSLGFLTLTVRHDRTQKCYVVKDRLLSAWRKLIQSRAGRKIFRDYNYVGDIRALEVKLSMGTGWHPHLHIIFVAENDLEHGEGSLREMCGELTSLWIKNLKGNAHAKGQDYTPVLDYKGIDKYITKWGAAEEITCSGKKINGANGSVTPFQILDKIFSQGGAGKKENFYLVSKFREYAMGFHGAKQLVFSRKLVYALEALQMETFTDEQIVKAKQESDTEISIGKNLFTVVDEKRLQADCLSSFEFGGVTYLRSFLKRNGIETFYWEDKKSLVLSSDKAAHEQHRKGFEDLQRIAWGSIPKYVTESDSVVHQSVSAWIKQKMGG